MSEKGYLEGSRMANAFNMLRSNDLVWPYVVGNYMLGKEPFPFDLLYWNADCTRMPAANHSFYLRKFYLENAFARGVLELAGEKLDLRKVTVPIYNLATREDHIAPARSVFVGSQLFGGPVRYVVAGSGHIAGVCNPPVLGKYQYWAGGTADRQLRRLDGDGRGASGLLVARLERLAQGDGRDRGQGAQAPAAESTSRSRTPPAATSG